MTHMTHMTGAVRPKNRSNVLCLPRSTPSVASHVTLHGPSASHHRGPGSEPPRSDGQCCVGARHLTGASQRAETGRRPVCRPDPLLKARVRRYEAPGHVDLGREMDFSKTATCKCLEDMPSSSRSTGQLQD